MTAKKIVIGTGVHLIGLAETEDGAKGITISHIPQGHGKPIGTLTDPELFKEEDLIDELILTSASPQALQALIGVLTMARLELLAQAEDD